MEDNVRVVKDMSEFADFITEIGGGWRTTFVYLNAASIRATAMSVDLGKFTSALDADQDLDPEVAGSLRGFANGPQKRSNRFPYVAILKASKYTLNWQSARNHMKNYNDFVGKSDELSARYAAQILKRQGLPLTQDALDSVQIKSRAQKDVEDAENGNTNTIAHDQRKDYRTFKDYGKGGMYVRPNDNDRVVHPQNMKTVTPGGVDYFLIKADGSIAGGRPVSEETIEQILSPKTSKSVGKASALAKLGANEEELKAYTEEFKELGWGESDFMADQIMYAVGSCTDDFHSNKITKVVFYNKGLINAIAANKSVININPDEFMAIAKKEIQDVYGVTVESKRLFKKIVNECFKRKKNLIRLTEGEFRKVIMESVGRLLREGYNNSNYTHFAVNKATGKIVNGWDYAGEDPEDLRQFKRDYFISDLLDYELNPKEYKILTAKSLMRMGIDPNDDNNWANR